MKPKVLFCTLLCIFTAFSSCKKSDDEQQLNPTVPKIKTITHYHGSQIGSENYEYDDLGRLVKITYTEGNYDQYAYRSDNIITKRYIGGDYLPIIDTLYLNNKGLVVNEFNGTTHEYTADGVLAKSEFIYSTVEIGISFTYKVSNGNTIGCELWESYGGNPILTILFEYEFSNKPNTIGNENKGISFYGKQDKNLVDIIKSSNQIIDDHSETTFTYEVDNQNRVVKKKVVGNPDNVYDTYTYYE